MLPACPCFPLTALWHSKCLAPAGANPILRKFLPYSDDYDRYVLQRTFDQEISLSVTYILRAKL